ncbi:unannotated protein [freshwater metagenome]|uniref:Unannotated protein n=1 Tax=freshwater metagenome TaxID=449393 RepID=A0A6J7HE23_9ZZZZ|nr:hypothetical protein [Actinomycetota bacterium]
MTMNGPGISKIPFFVISMTKTYRSKSLISYLEKENMSSFHVQGIPGKDISLDKYVPNNGMNRSLSRVEIAVGISHIEARTMGLSMQSDWIFVLEDDAIIVDSGNLSKTIMDVTNFFDSNKPIAVSFFAGQFGVFRKIRMNIKYLKVLKVPDYSVATLYSKEALVVLNQSISKQVGQTPDWPPVLKRQLHWYAINDLLIDHPAINDPNSASNIREERLKRKEQNNVDVYRLKQILNYINYLMVKPFSYPFPWGTIETEKLRSRILRF